MCVHECVQPTSNHVGENYNPDIADIRVVIFSDVKEYYKNSKRGFAVEGEKAILDFKWG